MMSFLEDCNLRVLYAEKTLGSLKGHGMSEAYEKWNNWLSSDFVSDPLDDFGESEQYVFNLLYDNSRGGSVVWGQNQCGGIEYYGEYDGEGYVWISNNKNNIMYNSQTPSSSDCEYTVVGCVPVALGQLLWKWKYPLSSSFVYKGEKSESVYNWDKMPADLNVNSSKEEEFEVSQLLRDCGFLLDAKYGCSGTSASQWKLDEVLPCLGYGCYKTILTEDYAKKYGSKG